MCKIYSGVDLLWTGFGLQDGLVFTSPRYSSFIWDIWNIIYLFIGHNCYRLFLTSDDASSLFAVLCHNCGCYNSFEYFCAHSLSIELTASPKTILLSRSSSSLQATCPKKLETHLSHKELSPNGTSSSSVIDAFVYHAVHGIRNNILHHTQISNA